jgi:hypothetical protein
MAKQHIKIIKKKLEEEMAKDEAHRDKFHVEGLKRLLEEKEAIVKKYEEKHLGKKLNNDKFFSREW